MGSLQFAMQEAHFSCSKPAVELVWQKRSGFLTAGILVENQCILDGFHGNETTLVGDFAFGIMLGSMKVTNVPNLDQSAMLNAQSNMEPHLANANLATMVVDNNIFLLDLASFGQPGNTGNLS